MRTAVAAALMMVLATSWAGESSAPDAKTQAAATATAKKRPFKPPYGYKLKRVEGGDVYCARLSLDGSRFKTEVCRTEDELREMQRTDETVRNQLERKQKTCWGPGCEKR
ncbi:MAG TPA: hypothetical protein VFO35_13725 [Steroidobacteraceae bacterium]|nr:hypothetical protein [Steroidobacteraceae bacterium]